VTRYGIVGFGRIGQRLAARLPGAVAVLTRSPVETAVDVPV
jgi:phosphoglycerate dehydrogenase-like enzyme